MDNLAVNQNTTGLSLIKEPAKFIAEKSKTMKGKLIIAGLVLGAFLIFKIIKKRSK